MFKTPKKTQRVIETVPCALCGRRTEVPILYEDGWQPIRSAPADQRILLWATEGEDDYYSVWVGRKFPHDPLCPVNLPKWYVGHDSHGKPIWISPSHWMPMPLSPD